MTLMVSFAMVCKKKIKVLPPPDILNLFPIIVYSLIFYRFLMLPFSCSRYLHNKDYILRSELVLFLLSFLHKYYGVLPFIVLIFFFIISLAFFPLYSGEFFIHFATFPLRSNKDQFIILTIH